jgi:hypothetical protein
LSGGSSVVVTVVFTGSPDSCQPSFESGIRPVSGQLSKTRRWSSDASSSRFPVAFRPPAFASGSSFARWGVGPSLRSADQTPRYRMPGPHRGCHVPHTQDTTGFGRPLYQRRCSHSWNLLFRLPPAALQRPVATTPLEHPIHEASRNEASIRGSIVRPSGLPLTCRPQDGMQALGLEP